ncbi:hypothetical protein LP421_11775 [Rhizobium sp. RCAM05350]|nr:hypothetical protein LP421_11775 [Rhizobium sp. RCAM05350]
MLHGGYSGKHSPSTASPETGSCTVVGFDDLGKPHPYVYMLLTIILCRPLALLFYNLDIVENLQTGSFSAIGTSGSPTSRLAMPNRTNGRKMGQAPA